MKVRPEVRPNSEVDKLWNILTESYTHKSSKWLQSYEQWLLYIARVKVTVARERWRKSCFIRSIQTMNTMCRKTDDLGGHM